MSRNGSYAEKAIHQTLLLVYPQTVCKSGGDRKTGPGSAINPSSQYKTRYRRFIPRLRQTRLLYAVLTRAQPHIPRLCLLGSLQKGILLMQVVHQRLFSMCLASSSFFFFVFSRAKTNTLAQTRPQVRPPQRQRQCPILLAVQQLGERRLPFQSSQ